MHSSVQQSGTCPAAIALRLGSSSGSRAKPKTGMTAANESYAKLCRYGLAFACLLAAVAALLVLKPNLIMNELF